MVRYLLGSVSEEERAELEERLFSDREFLEQLVNIEDSLIDDYVTGEMPAEERSAFREAFFPNRSGDVRFARALIQAITKKKLDTPTPVVVASQRSHTPRPITSLISVGLAMAALIFLVVSVALFFGRQSLRDQLSQSEARLAEAREQNIAAQRQLTEERSKKEASERQLENERRQLSDAVSRLAELERGSAKPRDMMSVLLSAANILRGSGGKLLEIQVEANIRWLRFSILLEKSRDKYGSYRITLRPARDAVFLETTAMRSRVSRGLVVIVGAEQLQPGDYILALYGEGQGAPEQPVEEYAFRITR